VTTVLGGIKVASPIMIASTAFHRMAHPDGEVAMAKAAENCETALSLSNWATSTNEEVGQAAPS
jgi:isopentenyl diphosphate isomerase/L-lactate dehydrogenase-like FMN-dependent dehydrogenase